MAPVIYLDLSSMLYFNYYSSKWTDLRAFRNFLSH
jgi:hypothetical protein